MTLADRVKDLRAVLDAVNSGKSLEQALGPRPDAERLKSELGTSLDGFGVEPVTPDPQK